MAFIDQVQDLTSLTVSDNDELSQFLKDGVIDVTNRWLIVRPQDAENFSVKSAEQTANDFDIGTANIISVIREAGSANDFRNCEKIPVGNRSLAADVDSLHFASKYNPVYYIDQDTEVSVLPDPAGSAVNGFIVYYVNNVPTDETYGASLIHRHSDIKYFPKDKVYLVVMYAGMKLLHAAMGATTVSDLSVNAVPPDVPTIVNVFFTDATAGTVSSISLTYANTAVGGTPPVYSSGSVVGFGSLLKTLENLSITAVPPDTPSDPSISSDGIATVGKPSIAASAPQYDIKTITGQTAFNSYWTLGDFGDSDPGSFSITAVPPETLSLSAITYDSIDSAITSSLVPVAASSTLTGAAASANVPTYTKPTATGGAGLTGMEAGVIADATDQIEFDTWWDTLGDLIETQEDTELAGAQIQKISTYISAYQTEIQNELNEFNKHNVKFQASLQESMAEFQSANQMAIADAERSQNRELQTTINDMKVIFDNNAQDIQKYNSDLQSYQAEVGTQVQEQTQNLQRYQTELNTVYQAWAKTESDNIQKFQLDTQNELNDFNEGNAIYQADLQVVLAKLRVDADEAQKEGDLLFQAKIQDYTLELQKYQADVATYQAEVNKEVEEWRTSTSSALQQHSQSMQDNLNVFNEDNVEYQALLQHTLARVQTENNVNIQEAQIELQDKMKDADLATQVSMQAAISDMQAIVAKNESRISKYMAEIQSYQAEVATAVQEYTQNLQGDGMGYQWLQDQYTRLKAEYDQAFMIAAPKQQEEAK